MEGSSSCEWNNDAHRGLMTAFVPCSNASRSNDAFTYGRDQFCMDSASAFPVNCIQEQPTENHAHLQSRYDTATEELELLNIPSIQETMSNSFDTQDVPAEQDSSATDWECFANSGSFSGDALCFGSDVGSSTCEVFDDVDDEPNTSTNAPREPLKRLRRQRANDRERRRMKSLNGALNNLKRCIPLPNTKRRVTKLEILRIACHYIQTLWETLNNSNDHKSERAVGRTVNRNNVVNGMTVTQRLSLLSNNLNFNFQL